jgi:acetoacetyl-CoA synthetase
MTDPITPDADTQAQLHTDAQPLWIPSAKRVNDANMTRFTQEVNEHYNLVLDNYNDLHRWSVDQPAQFWAEVWRFTEVRSSQQASAVFVDNGSIAASNWFEGARLNYAENLLRRRDDGIALIGRLEDGSRQQLTYAELYEQVARLAAALRADGIGVGDCVAGYVANTIDTVVAMLATTSLGAIWSSCSPDFGFQGVMDRFGQIKPKVLFALDGYLYNGKYHDSLARVSAIATEIDSLTRVVIMPTREQAPEASTIADIAQAVALDDYLVPASVEPMAFAQLPFNHPLFIMYSSGTTGVPKCIVHSAGGTLLQHRKEHQLHVGLTPASRLFFFTTCGWMMWNWLVSGLASGATLVLYDGSPLVRDGEALLELIDSEQITVFGVGAKYLSAIEKNGIKPREQHQLDSLATVLSTGSPLSAESFEYVYRDFKADICLASISGGTDILSCFVLGNECLPVYAGELQCPGLGMAVDIWDDEGQPLAQGKGELVCTRPFPSCPIGLWDDADGSRFFEAYFARFAGVWAQGDYGEFTPHGGMLIHGRSDAVLNPGGVRIGTAEIYRQVELVDEVLDSIVIGQQWLDDVRVVLFVKLRDGLSLDEVLEKHIRQVIRSNTTPRHVPAKIIQVDDLPRTLSGKLAELAVRNVVHGIAVKNKDALANPEALALFSNLPALHA